MPIRRKMAKAAQTLPVLPPLLDERTNDKLYRTISFINSAQSRQNFFVILKEQYGEGWLEQKRADITPHPARWLANGLINAYWRNQSGIEGIHAGEWEARPLLQRRITPMQEYTIVQKVAEGIVPSMQPFTMSSIRRVKMVGRNEPYHLRLIFRPQITGRSPIEQQRCCSKGLNRNRALGATKSFALAQKSTLPSQDGLNLDHVVSPDICDDKQGFAKYL